MAFPARCLLTLPPVLIAVLTGLLGRARGLGLAARDNHHNCAHWADIGECTNNEAYMAKECAASCAATVADASEPSECAQLVKAGRCRSDVALVRCRASCFRALKANLTEDLEGNCFYWATDGECEANPQWMATSCARSCSLLRYCGSSPESPQCAKAFECPLERDRDNEHTCSERARQGACRSSGVFSGRSVLERCSYTCSVLDPPSASHSVTRPMVKRSPHIDAHIPRHQPGRCHHIGFRRALLGATCPNVPPRPTATGGGVLRLEADADSARAAVDERAIGGDLDPVVADSPRVRLLHDFVTPHEAESLISLAGHGFHRSSTARAGSDDKRTSNSATLNSRDTVVSAVRHRIAFYCGYPEANLEPLQVVRYKPGEFYKPHHDYYNACETWVNGNRHFTFLIYLNDVEEGGETVFPRLNLTVTPKAYTALVFNNCLDNGEPDERSLHEGVPPVRGIKYAINGWVRSKHLFE